MTQAGESGTVYVEIAFIVAALLIQFLKSKCHIYRVSLYISAQINKIRMQDWYHGTASKYEDYIDHAGLFTPRTSGILSLHEHDYENSVFVTRRFKEAAAYAEAAAAYTKSDYGVVYKIRIPNGTKVERDRSVFSNDSFRITGKDIIYPVQKCRVEYDADSNLTEGRWITLYYPRRV